MKSLSQPSMTIEQPIIFEQPEEFLVTRSCADERDTVVPVPRNASQRMIEALLEDESKKAALQRLAALVVSRAEISQNTELINDPLYMQLAQDHVLTDSIVSEMIRAKYRSGQTH